MPAPPHPDVMLDTSNPPFWKWFVGGRINASTNCVDRSRVVELLDRYELAVKRLSQRRALLEEELLTRIEGHQSQ